jgi:hypothetical protein
LSYSDDQVSSAKPFVGDETGTIFNAPDVVLQSPTTTERVIDTQSGFLVVVKHLGIRDTLSVRRRIGTPPSSSILLTPDESLRLAQILTEEKPEQTPGTTYNIKLPQRDLIASREDQDDTKSLEADFKARKESDRKRSIKIAALATLLVACLFISTIYAFKSRLVNSTHKESLTEADIESHVNQFARNYVIYLLDFNPQTYRFSQIQAMSSMSTDLMEKYWQETHFPISVSQLKNTGQTHTLTVNKVLQEKPDPDSVRLVEVFGEIKNKQTDTSHPIHLQLKLQASEQGQIRVLAQKDMG